MSETCTHIDQVTDVTPSSVGPATRQGEGRVLVSYRICTPLIARAITRRWISDVPSKIV
jgi:hypothetical protein